MRILGIAGSLRAASYNRQLLCATAAALPAGLVLELFDGLGDVPPYDEDADAEPPHGAVARLRSAIADADAILIATPEYNASIPGQLKNALDWASRPFPGSALQGRPAAVIGASTGLFGAVWAQAELRKVLATAGARVVDDELPICHAHHAFAPDGSLVDPDLQAQLVAIVERLASIALAKNSIAPVESL
jgi:chromate reductase